MDKDKIIGLIGGLAIGSLIWALVFLVGYQLLYKQPKPDLYVKGYKDAQIECKQILIDLRKGIK